MIFVTNDDTMGKNIRYLREKSGLSQKNFGKMTGLDCDTLDAIEKGKQPEIDGMILEKISLLFQVTLKNLIEKKMDQK